MLKHRGLTLIEVLITLTFAATSIIAIIKFQNYLAYNNSVAKQQGEAINLATNQIENLIDYQVTDPSGSYKAYSAIQSNTQYQVLNGTAYTIITNIVNFTSPDYKTAQVIVQWTDMNNTSRNIELNDIIAKLNPVQSALIM